jgi:hypothetical protein
VFDTNKTKGPKQENQNRPRKPIPERVKGNARVKKCILYITELVLRKLYTILSNPIHIAHLNKLLQKFSTPQPSSSVAKLKLLRDTCKLSILSIYQITNYQYT